MGEVGDHPGAGRQGGGVGLLERVEAIAKRGVRVFGIGGVQGDLGDELKGVAGVGAGGVQVMGPGSAENVKMWSIPRRSGLAGTIPEARRALISEPKRNQLSWRVQ